MKMNLDKLKSLEDVLWRFEDAWQEAESPDLKEFLSSVSPEQSRGLLMELAMIDLEHRIRRLPNANADKYFEQYREFYTDSESRNDLIRQELQLRRKWGEFPTAEEFQQRFPNDSGLELLRLSVEDASNNSAVLGETISAGSRVGTYEIECKIGTGVFSDVYRARDVKLNRLAALKFLKPWTRESKHLRTRMLREAQAVATLQHPHVVPVFETGTVNGHDYIASLFVNGPTLTNWVRDSRPDRTSTVRVVAQLASALDAAHSNGIIHRDIKPDNVMMDDGRPMLLDFGLAHFANASIDLTHDGDIVGTPAYMSPEQASGVVEVGPASDIYSLGVILYQLLTGQLPFAGGTASLLHQTIHEEPVAPRRLDASIPVDLQTICLKAMARSPVDRYLTAQAMADDLWRFHRDEPILARPAGWSERLSRLARRHPIASGMAALLVIGSVFALGGALQYLNVVQQRNRATGAEEKTRELLARESATAGQLAQQQGLTKVAVKRYQEAIDRGIPSAGYLHLGIASCEFVNGNVQAACAHLKRAEQDANQATAAEVALLKLQLALVGVPDFGDVPSLLRSVPSDQLTEPDQEFLAGLRAAGSLPALEHFRTAIELSSRHHGARRMACLVALSLADLDVAIDVATISQQLFPEDPDFAIIEALALAAQGKVTESAERIEQTQLSDQEKAEWQKLVHFIQQACHDLNSGGERVFYKELAADNAELSFDRLVKLLTEFQTEFAPLLRGRRWHLPPAVEFAFRDFLAIARNRSTLDNLLSLLSPANSNDQDAQLVQTGIAIVKAHPEATLSTVIARHLLDLDSADTEVILQVQFFYEQAMSANGFIRDVREHARIGAFAVAIHLDRVAQHEQKKNRNRAYELLETIGPETVTEIRTARILSLVPMQEQKWDLAARFTPRWVELARNQDSNQMLFDAIWHHALVSRSQGRWLDVVKSCDEIMPLTTDTDGLSKAEGLRDQAISQVIDVAGHKGVWSRMIEVAIELRNWKLAETSLAHFKNDQANDESDLGTSRLYGELVAGVKADNETRTRQAINEIESALGPISDRLMRIRQRLLNADQNSDAPSQTPESTSKLPQPDSEK